MSVIPGDKFRHVRRVCRPLVYLPFKMRIAASDWYLAPQRIAGTGLVVHLCYVWGDDEGVFPLVSATINGAGEWAYEIHESTVTDDASVDFDDVTSTFTFSAYEIDEDAIAEIVDAPFDATAFTLMVGADFAETTLLGGCKVSNIASATKNSIEELEGSILDIFLKQEVASSTVELQETTTWSDSVACEDQFGIIWLHQSISHTLTARVGTLSNAVAEHSVFACEWGTEQEVWPGYTLRTTSDPVGFLVQSGDTMVESLLMHSIVSDLIDSKTSVLASDMLMRVNRFPQLDVALSAHGTITTGTNYPTKAALLGVEEIGCFHSGAACTRIETYRAGAVYATFTPNAIPTG